MTLLNDLKQIKKMDKENMAELIAGMAEQCLAAYRRAKKIKLPEGWIFSGRSHLPKDRNDLLKNIVVSGMGGSAIGGELSKDLASGELKIPLIINRNWNLPALVDKETLAILVSFSGNTQETIFCARQAVKKGAKIIVLASGGKLAEIAKKEKIPVFLFKCPPPPRAGLGYTFMPIIAILEKFNLIKTSQWQIEKSLGLIKNFNQTFYPEVPTEKNRAKYLAYFIFDHLPVIIAPEKFASIARRWKTQIAENSKNFAFFETSPEIFHNSIESQFPLRLKDEIAFLFFEALEKTHEMQKSVLAFQKLLDKNNIRWEKVPGFGNNLFIKMLSLVLLGDWVSFYLAILNKIDPTPVERIQWLKHHITRNT